MFLRYFIPAIFLLCFQTATLALLPYRPSPTREVLSLDGLWNFQPDNLTTPLNTPQVNVNMDLSLMPVPSSYNDVGTQTNLREYAGSVTYSRRFFVPESWKDKRVWIRFGSVCYSANVTINGEYVIEHSIGHLPFGTEVTQIVNYGNENFIKVVVDNILTDSTIPQGGTYISENGILTRTYSFDFFDYSGIDRSVILYTTSQTYIDDIAIITEISGNYGIVSYSVSISNQSENTILNVTILNENREVVKTISDGQTIYIENPNLWWPYTMHENPGYLYTLRADLLENGKLIDRYDQPFGIRVLQWNNESFTINSKPIYLTGFGKHEDSDFRGKGTDLPLFIKDYNLIRWLGANSYRTSHYPYSEELMDLADQLGIMIINEVPAVNLEIYGDELLENHKKSFTELYTRDKNRPSVVIWSCANEPTTQYTESGPYFEKIVAHIKSLDISRPVTAAIAQSYDDDNAGYYLDIISFNRYQGWYENTGKLDEITNLIISEAEEWHYKYNKPVMISMRLIL